MARLRRAGRAFERVLGVFDVMAGYGTRRSRKSTKGSAKKR